MLGGMAGCAATSASHRAEAAGAAPSTETPTDTADLPSLYTRLGGLPAITLVVEGLLERAFSDERINYTWAGSALPRVRTRLIEFICVATGGDCIYTGRDMERAHRHLTITGEQFDVLVQHLISTLEAARVPAREQGELLALLGPLKDAIVRRELP